jgi:hypothetical protein
MSSLALSIAAAEPTLFSMISITGVAGQDHDSQKHSGNQYITKYYNILQSITTYYYRLTKKQTDNSSENMNYYPMINLMQGIPHVHLKNAKVRNQPKSIEKQMSSSV